jgi:hypothetical protein
MPATPRPHASEAPTQPMAPVPTMVAADEQPTTPGYTPLWARHPAGPPRD